MDIRPNVGWPSQASYPPTPTTPRTPLPTLNPNLHPLLPARMKSTSRIRSRVQQGFSRMAFPGRPSLSLGGLGTNSLEARLARAPTAELR